MATLSWLLFSVYALSAAGLFVYGINCYVMLALSLRRRSARLQADEDFLAYFYQEHHQEDLPTVTTQIPIYNEFNVVSRIIRAVADMTYPSGKHQIQILDDSTDNTAGLVQDEVKALQARGIDIQVIRRKHRSGFKAGALANGLKNACGEIVAVFDADFVPRKDFLLRTVPFFLRDDRLGIVQTRWGHLNRSVSLLTRIQALGIDGHFMIEQSARAWNGLFMNFNGTAGLFRKIAIGDAGGWQADTLTEDMDLSYRIQLKGWNVHYSLTTVVPAELPENIHAFKSQQFRWAKGSIQTALKLMGTVMRSDRTGFTKLQAFLHMTHYCVHPMMLILSLLALPVLLTFPVNLGPWPFVFFAALLLISMTGPSALYVGSQACCGPGWLRRMACLPLLVCMGVGLAVSNTRGVLEALLGKPSPFVRTPKKGKLEKINYSRNLSSGIFLEIVLSFYCLVSFAVYILQQKYLIGPFLFIYAAGFGIIGLLGVWHGPRRGAVSSRTALTALSGLAMIVCCLHLGGEKAIGERFESFLALYGAIFALALFFFLILPKWRRRIKAEIVIFSAALLCRLALFNLPVSDDMNRYRWEGLMFANGVNPYVTPPDSESLQPYRTATFWGGINHPNLTACYPPGALYLFSQLEKTGGGRPLFKGTFIAFDLAALLVIFALLRIKKRDARMAVLYALNPVILISFAGQGHLDSMMIFFVCAALLARHTRKWLWMFVLMGCAFQSKQIALIFLPALLTRENLRHIWALFAAALLPYVPFLEGGLAAPLQSLFVFGTSMAHNGSVHGLLRLVTGSVFASTIMCAALFATAFAWTCSRRSLSPELACLYIAGTLIIFSPTVHFWYIAWLIPFLCFYPAWSWLILCGSIGLYFISDTTFLNTGLWRQPVWAQVLQWLPLYCLLLPEGLRRMRQTRTALAMQSPETVTIVVPTLNAGPYLDGCLRSLYQLRPPPLDIIVVDGGSGDKTLEIAGRYPVRLIESPSGRGIQISRGLQDARGDITVVVHADTLLEPDTLARIAESFHFCPESIGGSVGQKFENSGFLLGLIEFLNDLRAELFGISFGDQVQFFRTDLIRKNNLVPRWPLMEDVELSLRMGRRGPRLYLWGSALVSNYKWEAGFARRFAKVIYLLAIFFIRKLKGGMNTDDLYGIYYRKLGESHE